MQNRPFVLLLPAWVADSLANSLIASLLTFFVRYIVQPEYSNQETWGCAPIGGSDDWRCDSTMVIAASFLAFLFGVVMFTPMWLALERKYGKRDIWLLWSFTNGLTFLCYAFVGEGDVYLCILMSVFNGAPAGAKFLADSIMADVIDYDEYLTGERAEATYTMFKGFLPKIAAIPASALPIALLGTFGHVPVEDGVIQEQPTSVRSFIHVTIIWIPFLLSFMAFAIKARFPLKTQQHIEKITEGIALHIQGKDAKDPVTGTMYFPVLIDTHERDDADLLDNFPGVDVMERIIDDPDKEFAALYKNATKQFIAAGVWLVLFFIITICASPLLTGDAQYIPVLTIVAAGLGVTAVAFTYLRRDAAKRMNHRHPSPSLCKKVLKRRRKLLVLRTFDAPISASVYKVLSRWKSTKSSSNVAPTDEDIVNTQTVEVLPKEWALMTREQKKTVASLHERRVKVIMEYFDNDKDNKLCQDEFCALQRATGGKVVDEHTWKYLCEVVGAFSSKGFSLVHLIRCYSLDENGNLNRLSKDEQHANVKKDYDLVRSLQNQRAFGGQMFSPLRVESVQD